MGLTCSWVALRRGSDARIKICLCRLNFAQGPQFDEQAWLPANTAGCSRAVQFRLIIVVHFVFCTRTVPCCEVRPPPSKNKINYYPDGWQYLKFVASFRNITFHPERNLHASRRLFADFSRLTFRHRASCVLGQAFRYSPENAFYIFNQQIYFIIWYLLDGVSLI